MFICFFLVYLLNFLVFNFSAIVRRFLLEFQHLAISVKSIQLNFIVIRPQKGWHSTNSFYRFDVCMSQPFRDIDYWREGPGNDACLCRFFYDASSFLRRSNVLVHSLVSFLPVTRTLQNGTVRTLSSRYHELNYCRKRPKYRQGLGVCLVGQQLSIGL